MRPRELLGSLLRRWYLVVVGVLATVGLGAGALAYVPPSFEARAYGALVPGGATYPEGSNPFLYLGGGTTMRDVLSRLMSGADISQSILQDHPGGYYSVVPDPDGGPLLMVQAGGQTPTDALLISDAVLYELPDQLLAIQEDRDVPAGALFTFLVVTEDRDAFVNRSNTNRAVLLAVAVGLTITVLATAWVDGRLLARRGRRRLPAGPESGSDLPGGRVARTERSRAGV